MRGGRPEFGEGEAELQAYVEAKRAWIESVKAVCLPLFFFLFLPLSALPLLLSLAFEYSNRRFLPLNSTPMRSSDGSRMERTGGNKSRKTGSRNGWTTSLLSLFSPFSSLTP